MCIRDRYNIGRRTCFARFRICAYVKFFVAFCRDFYSFFVLFLPSGDGGTCFSRSRFSEFRDFFCRLSRFFSRFSKCRDRHVAIFNVQFIMLVMGCGMVVALSRDVANADADCCCRCCRDGVFMLAFASCFFGLFFFFAVCFGLGDLSRFVLLCFVSLCSVSVRSVSFRFVSFRLSRFLFFRFVMLRVVSFCFVSRRRR